MWKLGPKLIYISQFTCINSTEIVFYFNFIGVQRYFILILLGYRWFTMCVSFRCIAKSFSYTYVYSFLSRFFSIEFITKYWVEFPVLYSRSFLVIYLIHSNLWMLIPNSWCIHPCCVSPLTISLLFISIRLFLFCK